MSTTEELSDIVNGSWAEPVKGKAPKRNRGIIERLTAMETIQRYTLGGVTLIGLKAIGIPTEDIFKVIHLIVATILH